MKKSYKIIIGIILLLVIVRVALPFIVEDYVNKVLNDMPGYKGHIEDVDLHLYRGAYEIENLVLNKVEKDHTVPFLEIKEIDLSIDWESIFKGALVGEVVLLNPKLNFEATQEQPQQDKTPTEEKEHWTETLKNLMPLTVNRFEVQNGKISYLDFNVKPEVNIHIDSLHLLALNLSNVSNSAEELPSSVTARGRTVGGGLLEANMEINVLKEIPDFDLDFQLTQVNLPSLNNFIKAYGKFDVEKGQFNMYSEVKLIDGELDGYIKPFFKDLKVLNYKKDAKEGNFFQTVWEAIAGLAGEVLENQPKDQVATQVPIKGNVNQPDTDTWKTIMNVLKHAFIKAFNQGIEGTVKHEE